MINYSTLNLVTAANPRSIEGSGKTVSSTKKKKVHADIILSVVQEKIKNEATGEITPTGKLKTIFKLSKECEKKIDLQNVVASIPKGYNAFVTRPSAQTDDSCVLFGSPKGKSTEKTRMFRAISLVSFLMATNQIAGNFGTSIDDVALLTVRQEREIEGLPEGFKWFFVEKSTEVAPLAEVAPVVASIIALAPVADVVAGDEGNEDEDELSDDEDEEIEEDPFA